MGKILALDYGTKRIGVALSDESKKIAFVRPFISASEKEKILIFISANDVELILLGLPKNLEGRETKMTQQVNQFKNWLKKNTATPIKLVDERFSTREVLSELKTKGIKLKQSRERIDSLVAQKTLQRFLNYASDYSS